MQNVQKLFDCEKLYNLCTSNRNATTDLNGGHEAQQSLLQPEGKEVMTHLQLVQSGDALRQSRDAVMA